MRRGTAAYLRTQTPAARVEEGSGFVSVSFQRGSVYLDGNPARRLVWTKGGRLRVPAGRYRVLNYIQERGNWLLSCTGDGPEVIVVDGAETRIELDERLHLDWQAERTDGGLKFLLGVSGHDGMEASLLDLGRTYVDRRAPATFEVYSRDGRKVGEGSLRYG